MSETKHQLFLRTDFKNQCSVGGSIVKCVAILQKNNYAALKINDVGIFLSLKYLFPFIFYLSGGKTYQPALILSWNDSHALLFITPTLNE